MKLRERAAALKTDVPAMFLAMRHRDTPVVAKILAGIAVVYVLSPVDLIPDFIPVIGFLDDLLIVPALIAVAVRLIPDKVLAECREQAAGMWVGGRPKRWYYAVPIVMVWIAVVALVLRLLMR